MRILSRKNTLRRSILLYRRLRHGRGHGVHSPFVYHLITKVIGERNPYYIYQDIDRLRRTFQYKEEPVSYADRRNPGKQRSCSAGTLFKRRAIRPRQGKFLFRLANYLKPVRILHIGPSLDLSIVYTSAYASGLECAMVDAMPESVSLTRELVEKGCRNPVDLQTGPYKEALQRVWERMETVDFVFFNTAHEQNDPVKLFRECAKHANEQTVFVFNEIKVNQLMRACWHEVCASPDVTVTVDLYSLGLAFFTKKLHKRTYKAYLK